MHDPDVIIRAADSRDVDALADVGRTSFLATYAGTASTADLQRHTDKHFSAAAIRNEIDRPDRGYLIAFVDELPAGMSKWCSRQCPAPAPEARNLQIQQLYVLPGSQRLGLGRKLVVEVCAVARELGGRGLWLTVWEHADWAISFYRKSGFQEIGTTDFELGDEVYTDLLMWSPLR